MKDSERYQREVKKSFEMKDIVIGVKYIRTSGDGMIHANWSYLPINGTEQIDFTENPMYQIVGVGFYRNIKELPNMPVAKETPWDSLSIQDKMFLCAYGSSGNKLSKQDIKEITERYGECCGVA
jgi:hypothetical protein